MNQDLNPAYIEQITEQPERSEVVVDDFAYKLTSLLYLRRDIYEEDATQETYLHTMPVARTSYQKGHIYCYNTNKPPQYQGCLLYTSRCV